MSDPAVIETETHECESCGSRVSEPKSAPAPDRIQSIDECRNGGTCTYVRIAARIDR